MDIKKSLVQEDKKKIKQIIVNAMGGKCQSCGYNKCNRALHFHHLDPKTKNKEAKLFSPQPWEVIEDEIKKCILLCANCHMEFHDGFKDLPGIYSTYNENKVPRNFTLRNRKGNGKKSIFSWNEIQDFYNKTKCTIPILCKQFKVSSRTISYAKQKGILIMEKNSPYSKDKLLDAVKHSKSFTQILKYLGKGPSGKRTKRIRKLINLYQINIEHFIRK